MSDPQPPQDEPTPSVPNNDPTPSSVPPVEPIAPVAPAAPSSATTPQPYGNPTQPPQGPPAYGAAYAAAPKPPSKGNGLAITAVILGGVSLLGAFVPFLNYVTGLPAIVGLVLGLIAIFRKRGSRGLAITGSSLSLLALILSIVLAVVYTAGFANAIKDIDTLPDFTASDLPVAPTAEPDDTAPSEENAQFGDIVSYDDGLEVSVSAPVPYTPGQYSAGADQANNVAFTVTVNNGTDANYDPILLSTVSSGGVEGTEIYDDVVGSSPNTVVPAGQSITYQVAYSVADPAQIVFELYVGSDYDAVVFQN